MTTKKKIILCIIITIPVLISGISIAYLTTRDNIMIENSEYATVYYIEGIPIQLAVSHGANEGIWSFGPRPWENQSDRPIEWQANIIEKLLRKALLVHKIPPRTLIAGRLEEAFGKNKEISLRLINAAKKSSLWASFVLRRKSPSYDPTVDNGNREVTTILNENNVFKELVKIFDKHGLNIKVKYVEKVLIGKDELPFDCQVWFSVEKKGDYIEPN